MILGLSKVYRSTHYQEQDDQNVDCSSLSKRVFQMGFNRHTSAQVSTAHI